MKSSDYIVFVECESMSLKTKRWNVMNLNGTHVGVVKWHGAFRKYAFFPGIDTVFDADCLYTIALHCEGRTKEHYDARKDGQ